MNASASPGRILLVDDHPVIRHGLKAFLGEAGLEVVGEAENGLQALEILETCSADVMLLDLSMDGMGGLDLLKRLCAEKPVLRIVILSMLDESEYAIRCLRAGAKGFLNKREPPEKIAESIRKVLSGKLAFSDQVVEKSVRLIASGNHTKGKGGLESLSDRELEVFREMGQGRKTREIAERLHLSVKTIETHYSHLKVKLGLRSSLQVAQLAARMDESLPAAPGADPKP
jgi:DNA-binding NarL/FixJ family response regulator